MSEPNNYSGVTINITAPTVNASNCNCAKPQQPYVEIKQQDNNTAYGTAMPNVPYYYNNSESLKATEQGNNIPAANNNYMTINQPNNTQPIAYPVQYYTNNYSATPYPQQQVPNAYVSQNYTAEPDMSASNEIIDDLNNRIIEEKRNNQNKQEKRIVVLTDEYIKSLENYLNNPNDQIRVMASKEVLKRFNEDRSRYDDAALNALVNKMLQDPSKLVRLAAMSALSSELASGNDYTVELLEQVQNNPNADREDVLEAADILLKMSATKKTIYVPYKNPQSQKQKVENNA